MQVSTLGGDIGIQQVATLPATVVLLAFLLDALVSELPERIHPVVLFGTVVGACERDWRRPRAVGVILALALPVMAGVTLGGLTALASRIQPLLGVAVASVALFSTFSLRMLLETARTVIALTDSDVEAARSEVRALVGRETESLSPADLRSAAVESAAENLADGLVGPLLAFALGAQVSIPVGIAVAAWLKAVNTMDSMLGYRSKPVGTASARLDDLAMWLPARVSAVLLALAALDPGAPWRARHWARQPASPNSGWPMATLAVAAGVRLSKSGAYTLNHDAPCPTLEQSTACVRTVAIAGLAAVVLAALGATAGSWSSAGVVPWF